MGHDGVIFDADADVLKVCRHIGKGVAFDSPSAAAQTALRREVTTRSLLNPTLERICMNANAVVFHYAKASTHNRSLDANGTPIQASQRESKSEWSGRSVSQVPVSPPDHVVNIRGSEDTKHNRQTAQEGATALRIRARITRDRTAQIAILRKFISDALLVRSAEARISHNKVQFCLMESFLLSAIGGFAGAGAHFANFIGLGLVAGGALLGGASRHSDLTDELGNARRIHAADVERATEWIKELEQKQAPVTARAFLERSLPTEIVDVIFEAAYPAPDHNAEPRH